MFIKSYNSFILESNSSFDIPSESEILAWVTDAEGGDVSSFSKLVDIVKNSFPKNYKDMRKINMAYKGWLDNKVLFN